MNLKSIVAYRCHAASMVWVNIGSDNGLDNYSQVNVTEPYQQQWFG